jgi:transcriptional regulator with XRE-family HTH domain
MEHLAQNLRSLRAVKGVTLDVASKELGINPKTLNKYETNICNPTVETLVKLAKYLGVSTDTLLHEKISLSYKIEPKTR